MKTYEKYCEAVISWASKIMIAATMDNRTGAKCAVFHDEKAKTDFYTDNFVAFAIPAFYNVLKCEMHDIAQLSDRYLQDIPTREIYRTNSVEIVPNRKGKKRATVSIFKDANGTETAINSDFLKLIDKYPFPLKYVQNCENSAVYVLDLNYENVVAILMPVNRHAWN